MFIVSIKYLILNALLLNLTDKMDLGVSEKSVTLSNLSIPYAWKKKAHIPAINLKYQLQCGMINFNYEVDNILYQIFKTILVRLKRKHQ